MKKDELNNPVGSTVEKLLAEIEGAKNADSVYFQRLKLQIELKSAYDMAITQNKYARALGIATYVLAFATIGLIISTVAVKFIP